jgi:hypothetical protein
MAQVRYNINDADVDKPKSKICVGSTRSIGRPAERWLARAGLFDSVNLRNTIAKGAIISDCD